MVIAFQAGYHSVSYGRPVSLSYVFQCGWKSELELAFQCFSDSAVEQLERGGIVCEYAYGEVSFDNFLSAHEWRGHGCEKQKEYRCASQSREYPYPSPAPVMLLKLFLVRESDKGLVDGYRGDYRKYDESYQD